MKFRVLRQVEAEVYGNLVSVGGPTYQLILVVLIDADGRMVTTEQLIDHVLGPRTADVYDPRGTIHSDISKLRGRLNSLEPGADGLIPRNTPAGYRLLARPEEVDLYRFRGLAKKISGERSPHEIARLAREALGEWGDGDAGLRCGEPLAGLDGPWATACRERWRREHLDVLVKYVDAELRLGNGAHLVSVLKDLRRELPLDERIVRFLMHAHYQAGNRLGALDELEGFEKEATNRQYRVSEETWDLLDRIKKEDPALRPSSGAAMSSSKNSDLAGLMADVLIPMLPFLTGGEVPESDERLRGASWSKAKELWILLHRSGAMALVPEARRATPDSGALRSQLQAALARDGELADRASAILAGKTAEEVRSQININGPYLHQGDNISGTSIKYYNG